MFYNLTDLEYSITEMVELFDGVIPLNWEILHINDRDTNIEFNPILVDDSHGISLKGTEFVGIPKCNMDVLYKNEFTSKYINLINKKFKNATSSSFHYMDKNGFLTWHTNQGESPEKPFRFYATYNDTEGSFFKYIPFGENVVVTINEPVGWYFKLFYVEDELLHCMKSNGNRYSLGMRF